ncbi:MAG: UvrD-helicase domain-containing protein, partial [Clostridia bacterium]|nr:UvrD-helicase domain-containing protein [Clostridia bacterium]
MISAIEKSMSSDLFSVSPSLSVTRKPADKTEEEKELGALFKAFRDEINSQFKAVRADICDRETEKDRFLKSGIAARAFTAVIKDFEREYAQIKRDENKLDYGDLEHFCLKLFQNRAIAEEIKSKYSFVFVDEYQDVNAVQEEIIRSVGGDSVFLVGDKKQAIYGFRGSCSDYFDKKFAELEKSSGALLLPHNFRSAENIIKFVNKTFSTVMTGERCGVDYAV